MREVNLLVVSEKGDCTPAILKEKCREVRDNGKADIFIRFSRRGILDELPLVVHSMIPLASVSDGYSVTGYLKDKPVHGVVSGNEENRGSLCFGAVEEFDHS